MKLLGSGKIFDNMNKKLKDFLNEKPHEIAPNEEHPFGARSFKDGKGDLAFYAKGSVGVLSAFLLVATLSGAGVKADENVCVNDLTRNGYVASEYIQQDDIKDSIKDGLDSFMDQFDSKPLNKNKNKF